MTVTSGCPLCGAAGIPAADRHTALLRACPACDVVFATSRSVGPSHYADAYEGAGAANLGALSADLVWPSQSTDMSEAGRMLKDAQRHVLRWLRQRYPPPAEVYDIGCGQGWFLSALRMAGYQPRGVDPGAASVALAHRHGFVAAVGHLEDVPHHWPEPAALTLFEVIEHLSDPLTSLRALQARFPGAPLLGSVPSERRWSLLLGREEWDYPPNHLTRWTPRSLRALLNAAGYPDVRIVAVPPTRFEMAQVSLRWMIGRRLGRFDEVRWTAPADPAQLRPLARELDARARKEWAFLPLEVIARVTRRTAFSWAFEARH